jgi:hypothetical protein
LLQQALAKANLTITQDDVTAETAHAAELSGVVDAQGKPDLNKWIQMATEEQGVSQDVYYRDSVWPSAALKKLTGGSITVTKEDIDKGFQANYAERVRCRAIVLGTMRRAQEVWAKARQNPSPDYFGDLAAEYSIEPTSKSLRGEVPPIRRFGPQLEDVALTGRGELSASFNWASSSRFWRSRKPVEVNQQEVRDIPYQDIFEKAADAMGEVRGNPHHARSTISAGTSQPPTASNRPKPANLPTRRSGRPQPRPGEAAAVAPVADAPLRARGSQRHRRRSNRSSPPVHDRPPRVLG